MQRAYITLEWIFLLNKLSKKIENLLEMVFGLILKGKVRLYQWEKINPSKTILPLVTMKLKIYGKKVNPGKELVLLFGRDWQQLFQSKKIQLIKRTSRILPHLEQHTWITGDPTFYTDANKSFKAGYKPENLSKVNQSSYESV